MNNEMVGEFVIVRSYHTMPFAGVLAFRNGSEVLLRDAIQIRYWEGAASLSQLAMEGVSKPERCHFAPRVDCVHVTGVVEIIATTAEARRSIQDSPSGMEPYSLKGTEMSDKMNDAMLDQFVIVRTYSAGAFAGILDSRNGREAVLRDAIRLWYWAGAASLSQMAREGVTRPADCKFAMPVSRLLVTEVIEIIEATDAARQSIQGVPSWKV